ncbi:peptidase [[Actinobacillus] muris]|uniref:Peptidase n=1 Tax=Muribacter muris TaxID=67855 RepID=A0A0J5P247_9PAST|nr:peptidase [Muribacter muris]KMK50608.1 peptidase [[Actinobacillus] muris] [Muribacter muris]
MHLIDIFKAGKRRDANGVLIDITPEQLQQAVDNYDPAFHEAPVVIGHPKDNHPAYAWVKRLALNGEVLQAEFDQIDPAFAELVEAGRFKKVSASFYLPDSPNNPKQGVLSLRHVGFLGAVPPAVKGLRNPEFNEAEEGVVDFADWAQSTLWRRFRNWLAGQFGEEEAEKALPEYLVSSVQEDAIREQIHRHQSLDEPAFNELPADQSPPTPTEPTGEDKMSEADKAELARLKAENEQLKAEKAQAEADKAAADLDAAKAENVSYAENLVKQGKLAPIAKEAAIALLNCSATNAAGQVVEFNEGESMLTLTKAFLEAQPQVLQFGEVATKDKAASDEPDEVSYAENDDPARIELDRKARAYMKQHNCDYATAVNAVL